MVVASPRILVFDSGLGGLTVLREVAGLRPDAHLAYVADDAAFPYGSWSGPDLVARLLWLMDRLIARHRPDCVVIACNTASTLVLPALRARFDLPFVGTVPAIKPAAEQSASRMFSVLATPGTVARDYTRELVARFAGNCAVTLVGSTRLAAMAEAEMHGEAASDADIRAEIAPCFVAQGDGGGARRTDVVTLSCTHYPLLLPRLIALAPWPVAWIDPAPAIARRVTQLLGGAVAGRDAGPVAASFTAGRPSASVEAALARFGLASVALEDLEGASAARIGVDIPH